MWYRLTRPVRLTLGTAAVVVLVAAGCAQGESADLNPDAQATVAAAVEATVSARLAATPGLMRVPPPVAASGPPTPTRAPTATPSPSPTPRPTATPVPTYTPRLTDYVATLGGNPSRYLDYFDEYSTSYLVSALLAGEMLWECQSDLAPQ